MKSWAVARWPGRLLGLRGAIAPIAVLASLGMVAHPARADFNDARCDYYPRGEDRAEASMPCVFSQRQGFVSIQGEDGRRHEFRPVDAARYVDQQGRPVTRDDDLGEAGVIYRTSTESIYVYWGLGPATRDRQQASTVPNPGAAFADEITCRTADEQITVLKNSRNQLIFQGRPDLTDEVVVAGEGRIVRGEDYVDRVFERSGFRHTVRTIMQEGRPVNYYITERGNEFLDSQVCR